MERDVRQKLVAIGVLAVVLGLAAQADSQNLVAKINAYMKPFVEANNFIGIIHISRGDSVLFQQGYGLANYELNVPNEPETRFVYSNSDYNVLALIIETASGRSYGDFLRANIFEPLGLRSTAHDGDASALIKNRATGMEPEGLRGLKLAPQIDWPIKTGNGSLVTTASDLAKFARSLFEGRLLRPDSLAKVMKTGPAFPYGWTDRDRFHRKIKASGGRSPGFVSSVDYVLDDGTCIVVLSNSYSPVTQDPIAPAVEAIVFGEPPRLEPTTPIPPKVGELSALAGRYQMPDDYFVPGIILTLEDRGEYLEARWGNGATTVIYPVGDGQFLDRSYWARVRFTRDEAGHVTGFLYNIVREFKARRLS